MDENIPDPVYDVPSGYKGRSAFGFNNFAEKMNGPRLRGVRSPRPVVGLCVRGSTRPQPSVLALAVAVEVSICTIIVAIL